jgi:hypothetical protein
MTKATKDSVNERTSWKSERFAMDGWNWPTNFGFLGVSGSYRKASSIGFGEDGENIEQGNVGKRKWSVIKMKSTFN